MTTNKAQNKKSLLNYLLLTGLLLGSISVVSIPSVMAQSSEDTESDIDKLYDDLEKQYTTILKSFGFVEPQLTKAQEEELDVKLAPLDAEFDKIFANGDDLTAEEESMVDELDKRYDAILESYGFKSPELTESQEKYLDELLAPIEEKLMELDDKYYDDEYYHDSELTPEQELQLESIDAKYNAILQEFGYVFPQLTKAQEEELDVKLDSLDAQYDAIFTQFDENLSDSEKSELNKQLDALDAKEASIISEFGFVEPQLTEAQKEELEKRLAPLDAQYDEIFGDYEECDGDKSDEHDNYEFHEQSDESYDEDVEDT